MVEQVWYTRAATGLRGGVGHQPRAATPGLRDVAGERFRRLEPLLRYRLPGGVNEYLVPMGRAPVGLTLRRVGEEWALIRRQPVVPEERLAKRFYFTHALTWRGEALGAREAIALWDWPGWRTAEAGLEAGAFDLDPLDPALVRAEAGEPTALAALLRTGELRDELGYTIAAFLALAPGQRLFIAADPARVAALIYGLTRALPAGLLADHAGDTPAGAGGPSFSTYEPVDALLAEGSPTIVGTCWWLEHGGRAAGVAGDALPEACSGARGIALHTFRPVPERQDWPGDRASGDYAQYAAAALTGGDAAGLARFLAATEAHGVATLPDLATWARRWHGELDLDEVRHLATSPPLLRGLLWRPEVRARLIELAGGPPGQARDHSLATVRTLAAEARTLATQQARANARDDAAVVDALRTLGEEALEATVGAIAAGREARAQDLFEGLVVMLAGGRHDRACAALFARVAAVPEGWPLRQWLLGCWASITPPLSAEAVADWLVGPHASPTQLWHDADRVLRLALPGDWRDFTLRRAILLHGGMRLPQAAVAVLGTESDLLLRVLPALAEGRETAAAASAFARSLAQLERPQSLIPGEPLTHRLLSICMEQQIGRDIVRAIVGGGLLDRTIEQDLLTDWLPELVWAFGRDAALGELIGRALRNLDGATLVAERTVTLLVSLDAWRDSLALARQDQRWLRQALALLDALDKPTFEERTLTELAGAIADATWTQRQIEQLLAAHFGARIGTTAELDRVVRIVGPALLGEDEQWRLVKLLAAGAKRAGLLEERAEIYRAYGREGPWTAEQRGRLGAALRPLLTTATATQLPLPLGEPAAASAREAGAIVEATGVGRPHPGRARWRWLAAGATAVVVVAALGYGGWYFRVGQEWLIALAAVALAIGGVVAAWWAWQRRLPRAAAGAAHLEARLYRELLAAPAAWPARGEYGALTALVGDYLGGLRAADLRRARAGDILRNLGEPATSRSLPPELVCLVAQWQGVARFLDAPDGEEIALHELARAVAGLDRRDPALAARLLPALGRVAGEALGHPEALRRLGEALLGSEARLVAALLARCRGRTAEACATYAAQIALPRAGGPSSPDAAALQAAVQAWRRRADRWPRRRGKADAGQSRESTDVAG